MGCVIIFCSICGYMYIDNITALPFFNYFKKKCLVMIQKDLPKVDIYITWNTGSLRYILGNIVWWPSYSIFCPLYLVDLRIYSIVFRNRHGRDRMVVGFTAACVFSAYHHWCCAFEYRSGRGVQYSKSTYDVNLLSKLSIIFKEWRVIVLFVL